MLTVSASIGISIAPAGGRVDPQRMIEEADTALYAVKAAGRRGHRVYRQILGAWRLRPHPVCAALTLVRGRRSGYRWADAGRQEGHGMARVFITGTAGFIGYHLAELLLGEGHEVHGLDGMTDYYDVAKRARHDMLRSGRDSPRPRRCSRAPRSTPRWTAFRPEIIVHLAAQAGVRYSLENPRAYVDANVVGSFNVMEAARRHAVRHLLMASTSSVYGANTEMPFAETRRPTRR